MENFETTAEFEAAKVGFRAQIERTLYGEMPKHPEHLFIDMLSVDPDYLGRKATLSHFNITVTYEDTRLSFPALSVMPNDEERHPVFIYICENGLSATLPIEEIIDGGFGIFLARADDICCAPEKGKGALERFLASGRWKRGRPSKATIWAWAISRIADYAITHRGTDTERLAVIGHSHLAVSALIAGGYDERLSYVIADAAGIGGSLLVNAEPGEIQRHILEHSDFYTKGAATIKGEYASASALLALSVPHRLLIGGDDMCIRKLYPTLTELSALYSLYGKDGTPSLDGVNEVYHISNNSISIHSREHGYFLGRDGWRIYMDYINDIKSKQ